MFQREDASLSLQLMQRVAHSLATRGLYPVMCPTSEFLNRFVLDNQDSIAALGWDCAMPRRDRYVELTDKHSSRAIIRNLTGLDSPPEQPRGSWMSPCVIKPKRNVAGQRVLYP
ncbi:MAG: hypothetical protein WB783_21520, partial [Arenicellales bacterium]